MIKGGFPYRPKAPGKPKAPNRRRPAVRARPALKRKISYPGPQGKKQKTVYKDDKAIGDLALFKVQGGRKAKKNLAGAWKLLNSQIQRNMYFIDAVNRFQAPQNNGLCGAFPVGSLWGGASFGAGAFTMPLHLWSLTAAPNVNQGTVVKPNAQWALSRTSASGTMAFTGGTPYAVGNTGGTQASQQCYPGQTDELKSVSVKMVLYGCLRRPVKYRIDLIQIMEPYLHPDVIFNQATPQLQAQNVIAFYDELTREYTYSPATFSNSNATKGKIKYLKSWTHLIQPVDNSDQATTQISSSNTETNVSIPHSHVFNIYERFNRHQRYNWYDTVTTAESTGQFGGYGGSDQPPTEAGDNQSDVQWKARIYLMVRALSPMPCIGGNYDANLSPSYDCSVRTYHVSLG